MNAQSVNVAALLEKMKEVASVVPAPCLHSTRGVLTGDQETAGVSKGQHCIALPLVDTYYVYVFIYTYIFSPKPKDTSCGCATFGKHDVGLNKKEIACDYY